MAKSAAEKMRESRNRDRLIEYRTPEPQVLAERARLEKDAEAWLRHYLPDRFPLPFGSVHKQIVRSCIRSMTAGTAITVAAPRGFGKTTVVWGMALFAVLTGLCRFPVVIGWKASAGAELLDQWLQALSDNERLREAYPCQCDPFADSTASLRLKGLIRDIETGTKIGCDVRKVRLTVILPSVIEDGRRMPQCALAGASMNGSIKGLNVGLLSGEALRPDIVLLDDPQDEDTADSEGLVAKVIKKIDYGIRSLAGPRRRLTVMAAVTCVNHGDVSEHLLTRPGTEIIKIGQVTSWPDGWEDKDSDGRKAWDAWNDARLAGLESLDGGKRARNYYIKHKTELAKGMAVSWVERYNEGDGLRIADPDAIYAAMWDFYELGEMAFMAERQNDPIKEGVTLYNLTPRVVMDRADESRAAGIVPEWAQEIFCATDINPSYALTTIIAAFGADQRAAVVWYGTHPMSVTQDMTDAQKSRLISAALAAHGKDIAAMQCRPSRWMIDGGGSPKDCVVNFCSNSKRTCGLEAITAFGRAGKAYRHPAKRGKGVKLHEQAHTKMQGMHRQWVLWDADYWREQAQRGWTGTLGAPGSCDLPKGHHKEFASQICAELLTGKVELNGRWVYDWKTNTSVPHDYGDCMAMLYALAAVNGIGTGGASGDVAPKRKMFSQSDFRR